MKRIVVILIILIGAISIYFFNINKDEYIKTHMWKYKDGAHFGDELIFEPENSNLILVNDKAGSEKTFFNYGFELIVKDKRTGEKGVYTNKGNRTN